MNGFKRMSTVAALFAVLAVVETLFGHTDIAVVDALCGIVFAILSAGHEHG